MLKNEMSSGQDFGKVSPSSPYDLIRILQSSYNIVKHIALRTCLQ